MAVAVLDFCSAQLKMCTHITLCLPEPHALVNKPMSERKVLWLLHGLSDDGSAWLRYSRVEKYALQHDIVVVMPTAGRSMYCDNCLGQNYFTHIAEELPAYLQALYGLSPDRDKNFVAGLSMGGMGAMKLALQYPDRYFAAGSFSGVLDLSDAGLFDMERVKNEFPFMLPYMDNPAESPLNPTALLDKEKHKNLPLYVACGLQDGLLKASYAFLKRAESLHLPVTSYFEDGNHEWGFWDRNLQRFLEFALK